MKKFVALGLAGAVTGALAAGSLGATATSAAAAVTSGHVAWCEQNYRSYNPATDSFIGYDGVARRCVSPGGTATFGFASPRPFLSSSPTQQNPPGNRYNVFPSENDPNYGANQNN